jgi:PhnB protein
MTGFPVPHLNFPGHAREALEAYAAAFGGRTDIRTYADLGMPAELPDASKVVFGEVVADGGFHVMAYDVPSQAGADLPPAAATRREHGVTLTNQPCFLALRSASVEEATGWWDALAAGAVVIEPFAASAWSAGFGMLTDRFGVTWVIDVAG